MISFLGKSLVDSNYVFPEIANESKYKIERFYSSNRAKMFAKDFGRIFHTNLEVYPLLDVHTVAFSALQFALYTHPKKLYLVGLDTSNNGHAFKDRCNYLVKQTIKVYNELKIFAQKYYPDVEIISVNPVGLKGIFKDVYTKKFLDEHPEISRNSVEVI